MMNNILHKLLLASAILMTVAGIGLAISASFFPRPTAQRANNEPIKVAAIGDSITDGSGDVVNGLKKVSYLSPLQALLGSKYQVLNFGVSGGTLLDSGNTPYRQSEAFQTSQQANPLIILIMLGTNDSKPQNWNAREYERQLKEFIDFYQRMPSRPRVYVMTPPAAYDNEIGARGAIVEKEIVPIVYRVATRESIPVIDIFALTKQQPQYFPDGVHPNAAGYALIANTVYAAIK